MNIEISGFHFAYDKSLKLTATLSVLIKNIYISKNQRWK